MKLVIATDHRPYWQRQSFPLKPGNTVSELISAVPTLPMVMISPLQTATFALRAKSADIPLKSSAGLSFCLAKQSNVIKKGI